LADAIFSDTVQVPLLAAKLDAAAAKAGIESGGISSLRSDIHDLLDALTGGRSPTGDLAMKGAAPCPLAWTQWAGAAWVPLFMDWAVDFKPIQYVASDIDARIGEKLVTAR